MEAQIIVLKEIKFNLSKEEREQVCLRGWHDVWMILRLLCHGFIIDKNDLRWIFET